MSSGKGSRARPKTLPETAYADRWDATFREAIDRAILREYIESSPRALADGMQAVINSLYTDQERDTRNQASE
jgi:hypothetical protein